jgi:hypothetical protein
VCILCVEWEKGKMTAHDGLRAVRELPDNDPHTKEVLDFLLQEIYNEEIERNVVAGMHQSFEPFEVIEETSIKDDKNYNLNEDDEWFDFWYNTEGNYHEEEYPRIPNF